ncbi:MAG: MBL fold metallo-hydrolase [Treponema sp.]|jgi:competence protein ComEC|nr:MBL fold metallo-hydrolase [Treponema sp.]
MEIAAHRILAFLSDLGIGKIDYFVLSHPHIDHIGGFPAIAE